MCVDYINIKDNKATGGATFYAGDSSINAGDVTGWIFSGSGGGGGTASVSLSSTSFDARLLWGTDIQIGSLCRLMEEHRPAFNGF